MDLHLKQWRNQQESEQQQQSPPPSAKIPKLHLDPSHHHHHHQQPQQQHPSGCSSLPLSLHEPDNKISSSNLPAVPDSTTRVPRMGSYFSLAQWQELEFQALIYRYMLAGAAVPHELLQTIKKSLLQSPTYFLHHPLRHYSHYQPALLQSGYWGRAAMDPEPGRCRRTDGKKWRCSRDVVAGQKYCERHLHRGRNRSRKPVEMPASTSGRTTTTTISNNNIVTAPFGGVSGAAGVAAIGCGVLKSSSPSRTSKFGLSGPSPPIDHLLLNHSSSETKNEHMGLFELRNEVDNRSDGHILRQFFDDWPRSLQEPDNNGGTSASSMNSATCLSISMPGNSSSDMSLKLSTGNGDQLSAQDSERDQPPLIWAAGWASNHVASMGGPLAEALRSSASNSSPTCVRHQMPRGST